MSLRDYYKATDLELALTNWITDLMVLSEQADGENRLISAEEMADKLNEVYLILDNTFGNNLFGSCMNEDNYVNPPKLA